VRRFKLRRPSPALVIACIALFVAMGGVSYGVATGSIDSREIRNGAVTTKDLRNNEVRGRDIRNSTIGGRDVAFNTLTGSDIKESALRQVPSAAFAGSAVNAVNAVNAGNAGNANMLGGVSGSGFVRKEAPAFAAIPLASGVSTAPGQATPAYDVDGNGYVHLQGTYTGSASPDFTLPAGSRPAATSRFAVRQDTGTAVLTITPTGAGTVLGTGEVSLDGVTFAAGG